MRLVMQAIFRLVLGACLLPAMAGCGGGDSSPPSAAANPAGAANTAGVADPVANTSDVDAVDGGPAVLRAANVPLIEFGQDFPAAAAAVEQSPIAKGYVSSGVVWKAPASGKLKVCWEMSNVEFATFVTERGWVRDAVTGSWPSVSGVRFVGWAQCDDRLANPADDPANIRIRHSDLATRPSGSDVIDANPRVLKLGSGLDRLAGGMVLNFQFKKWSTPCDSSRPYAEFSTFREFCIRAIATHEFGHAMGLAHEQNRVDGRPASCTMPAQGENGDVTVGDFDMQSVMNYCVRNWAQGQLSVGDRTTASRFYPYSAEFVTAIVSAIDRLLLQDP